MTVVRWHIAATYALLFLGTLGVWLGESENVVFPYPFALAMVAAVCFWFVDVRGGQAPIWLSNALGLVILTFFLWEFAADPTAAVVALAHLLALLQGAKFLRRKQDIDYWQLYGLNVLQLAVACVINRNLNFGLLIVGYTLLALATLMLFQLRRQHEALAARGCAEAATGAGFIVQWLGLATLSLPLALAAFWALPRSGPPSYFGALGTAAPLEQLSTGFSPTIRLDEMQPILENKDVVLNVWPTGSDGKPANLPDDLLWRGQVFLNYRNGQWAIDEERSGELIESKRREPVKTDQMLLRVEQQILTGTTIFAPQPLFWARAGNENDDLYVNKLDGRLRFKRTGPRDVRTPREPVQYSLIVGRGSGFVRNPIADRLPSSTYLSQARTVPNSLVRLKELAATLVTGAAEGDVAARINRMIAHFRAGGFTYTLDNAPVDHSLDPVEDFLFNRKSGHCEYYATSMALLLRAAGVPTRVVNGFKGADYNQAGGYYQVRQLLAHSWVEAWIAKEDRWETIDPTPGEERTESVARQRSPYQTFGEWLDALRNLWYGYVVGYSDSEQKQLAYTVLSEFGKLIRERALVTWNQALRLRDRMATRDFWLSRQGLAAAAGLLLIAGAFVALPKGWLGRWRPGWRRSRRLGGAVSIWPLYRRWLAELARRGWSRGEAQTHLEFASEVANAWRKAPTLDEHSELPVRMASLFYAARFGGATIEAEAATEIGEQLRLIRKI